MLRHHFLLISFPAQGHINPSLQFAKRLIHFGAHVTFSTTLHLHRRISNKPTIPCLSYLPFSDGYDDGFTATTDTDHALYSSEYKRRLSEFVTDLIPTSAKQGHPFTCLITTLFLPSAAKAARAFHIPTILLWIQPATVFDIHYHYFHGYRDHINEKITKEPSSCSLELPVPGLPLFQPNRDLPSFYFDPNSSLNALIISIFEEQFLDLDQETGPRTVLLNTFEDLESNALRAVDKFELISIGPLIPSALLGEKDSSDSSFGGDIIRAENDYFEWLDSKAEESVVYVSFGSFCVLPKKQMEEIARALLDCGCPFLWVIREKEKEKEEEEDDAGELSCREELEERGKIVKWCSQVEVLSHASLGCFLTHCGWNSTLESLVSGVPMVAFPRWLDQKTNAKLIEDVWETGVRVDYKVNEEGIVEAEQIRMCLDAVMGNKEKGEQIRKNAKKWKGLAREAVKQGGSSDKNLRAFIDDIGQYCIAQK